MTKSAEGISSVTRVRETSLKIVKTFKYPEIIITDKSSKPEVMARIVQTTIV